MINNIQRNNCFVQYDIMIYMINTLTHDKVPEGGHLSHLSCS